MNSLLIVKIFIVTLVFYGSYDLIKRGLNGVALGKMKSYKWWSIFTDSSVSGTNDEPGCQSDEKLATGNKGKVIGWIYILIGVINLFLGLLLVFFLFN